MVWDFPYWFLGLVLVAMGYLDLAFDVPLPAQFILGAAIVVPGGAFSLTAVTQVAEMGAEAQARWTLVMFIFLGSLGWFVFVVGHKSAVGELVHSSDRVS